MKYLNKLQRKKIFTLKYVTQLTGNVSTAKSLLQSYKKAGYITSIRRDMYAALDVASGAVIANRYEIGSQVSEGACISYHTAMEFYGVTNQVYYEVSISSKTNASRFAFDGVTYTTRKTNMDEGIVNVPYNDLVRVTSIERTLADCMRDIELAGGIEELLQCISLIPQISEEELLKFLRLYDEKFLWQKAGFLLEPFAAQLRLSDGFFAECESGVGKRKNYLGDGTNLRYNSRWKLYAPAEPGTMINEGSEELV